MNLSLQTEIEFDQYAEINNDRESGGAESFITSQDLMHFISHMNVREAKPPPLDYGTYSGKQKDNFAFLYFLITSIIRLSLGNI